MNIISIMNPKVNTAFLHTYNTVRQGLEVIRHHGYTALPVLNEGDQYVGCITEGDFLRCMLDTGSMDLRDYEHIHVSDILRRDFCPALGITADLSQVVGSLLNQNFVPIVDGRNMLCGIITRKSLISYLSDKLDAKAAEE